MGSEINDIKISIMEGVDFGELSRLMACRFMKTSDILQEKLESTTSYFNLFVIDIQDITNKLCDLVNELKNIIIYTDYYYTGLGCVFRSIGHWFKKAKWLYLENLKSKIDSITIINNLFNRKTTRSTKYPLRLKSWKGRR